MTRDELARRVCCAVLNGEKMTRVEMEKRRVKNINDYKSGLYFLYNAQDECIYIGMVSSKNTSSLYMRMKGNGDGSHRHQTWYQQVTYGYWKKFPVLDDDIATLERLAIYGMGQPIYNDKNTDAVSINNLSNTLKSKGII